ncbi:hypothetical protein BV898_19648 [Hypsibius exemplaris]|uniref:Uncharacterized protein n=1 Tax=Hypsibius exemplaris TaxID=2072580 RepID=A0A9X6NK23_HYPEX|nr:hypothetical protein BV898_19648 [Hypsibius exemplaris]
MTKQKAAREDVDVEDASGHSRPAERIRVQGGRKTREQEGGKYQEAPRRRVFAAAGGSSYRRPKADDEADTGRGGEGGFCPAETAGRTFQDEDEENGYLERTYLRAYGLSGSYPVNPVYSLAVAF